MDATDDGLDEGDRVIELGDLSAQHLGRVIQLGRPDLPPNLTGALLDVRHSYSDDAHAHPSAMVTELTINWMDRQQITVRHSARTSALLRNPTWGAQPFVDPDGLD